MEDLTWEYLVANAPDLIKNILDGLKNHIENPEHHPEGDAYTHIKTVVTRLEDTGDVNLILAGFFHDLGKLETAKLSDDGDYNSSHGHENVSSDWVMKYKDWITELGGNPYIVDDIVKNHMRIKFGQFNKKDNERLNRQTDPNDGKTIYQKLNTFMAADNMKQDFNLDEARLKKDFKTKPISPIEILCYEVRQRLPLLYEIKCGNNVITFQNMFGTELRTVHLWVLQDHLIVDRIVGNRMLDKSEPINVNVFIRDNLQLYIDWVSFRAVEEINEARLRKSFKPTAYYHLWDTQTYGYLYSGRNSTSLDELKEDFICYISGDYEPEEGEPEEPYDYYKDHNIVDLANSWEFEIHKTSKPIPEDDYHDENDWYPENDSDFEVVTLNEARLKKQFKPAFSYQPFTKEIEPQYGDHVWSVDRNELMEWLDNYGINDSSIQDMADEGRSIVIDFVDDNWRTVEPDERERVWKGVVNDLKFDLIRMKLIEPGEFVNEEIIMNLYYNPFEDGDNLLTLRISFNRPYMYKNEVNESKLTKLIIEARLKKEFKIKVGDDVVFGLEWIHFLETTVNSVLDRIRFSNPDNDADRKRLKHLLETRESFLEKTKNMLDEVGVIISDANGDGVVRVKYPTIVLPIPLKYLKKHRDLSEAEIKIKPELNEDINFEYLSDGIRYDALKDSLNDEVWDNSERVFIDDLENAEWLTMVLNKKDYLDYYELFVDDCWDALYQKDEYKGLSHYDAVYKILTDRFTKIANTLGLKIRDWSFDDNILNIEFGKTPKTTILNEGEFKSLGPEVNRKYDVKDGVLYTRNEQVDPLPWINRYKEYINYVFLVYKGKQLKYYPEDNKFYIARDGSQFSDVNLKRANIRSVYMNNDWITGNEIEHKMRSWDATDVKEHNGAIYFYGVDKHTGEQTELGVFRVNKSNGHLEDYYLSEARLKKPFKMISVPTGSELEELLITWLSNEYFEDDARQQIENAEIKIDENGIITITYDNGVIDRVQVINDNVRQLSEARLRGTPKTPKERKKSHYLEHLQSQIMNDTELVKAMYEYQPEIIEKIDEFLVNNDYNGLTDYIYDISTVEQLDEMMDWTTWDGTLRYFVHDTLDARQQLAFFNKLAGETFDYDIVNPEEGTDPWDWEEWDDMVVYLKDILYNNYIKISDMCRFHPEFCNEYRKSTTLFEARLKKRIKTNWDELTKWVRSDEIKALKHPNYDVTYGTISWDIIELNHYGDNPSEDDLRFNFNRYKRYWGDTYGLRSFKPKDLNDLKLRLYHFLDDEYRKHNNLNEARLKGTSRKTETTGNYPNGKWFKKKFDDNGNIIYYETSYGRWIKYEYDQNGNQIYFENSDGYWKKYEYDQNGNIIYWEDSDGDIEGNREGLAEARLNLPLKKREMVYKTKCNNCDEIFVDPQVVGGNIKTQLPKLGERELEWMTDYLTGESFWGCPTCETDSYLMNIGPGDVKLNEAKTRVLPRKGTVKIGPVLVQFERHIDDSNELDPEAGKKNKVNLDYIIGGGTLPNREDYEDDVTFLRDRKRFMDILKDWEVPIREYFESRGYTLWTW